MKYIKKISKPLAWQFTGKTFFYGITHQKTCALCHRTLTHAYLVTCRNINHGNMRALVGPECASSVYIPDAEKEGLIPEVWLARERSKLLSDARKRYGTRLLITLGDVINSESKTEKGFVHRMSIMHSKGNPMTAKQIGYLGLLATRHDLPIPADLFQVDLRNPLVKESIKNMDDAIFQAFINTLSAKRQTASIKLRTGLTSD